MKNFVRYWREQRGWTLDQLSEKSGVSLGQISRIERAERGWSVDSLQKLAKALDVSVAQLLDNSLNWQQVPVFGIVEGDRVYPRDDTKKTAKKCRAPKHVKAPVAFGELIALVVAGEGQYPRHLDGELIFFTKEPVNMKDCATGRECLVYLENGIGIMRQLFMGNQPDRYDLLTHNASPIRNARIISARPVVYTSHGSRDILGTPDKS